MGFVAKELGQTHSQYGVEKVVKGGNTRDVWGLEMYEEQKMSNMCEGHCGSATEDWKWEKIVWE